MLFYEAGINSHEIFIMKHELKNTDKLGVA